MWWSMTLFSTPVWHSESAYVEGIIWWTVTGSKHPWNMSKFLVSSDHMVQTYAALACLMLTMVYSCFIPHIIFYFNSFFSLMCVFGAAGSIYLGMDSSWGFLLNCKQSLDKTGWSACLWRGFELLILLFVLDPALAGAINYILAHTLTSKHRLEGLLGR